MFAPMQMTAAIQTIHFDTDINVFGIPAPTFPLGIHETFTELRNKLGNIYQREFFGLKYPDKKGHWIYYATTTEQYPGEAEQYAGISFMIPQGNYLAEILTGWKKKEMMVNAAFIRLSCHQKDAGNFMHIEWHKNTGELLCMVRAVPG